MNKRSEAEKSKYNSYGEANTVNNKNKEYKQKKNYHYSHNNYILN